MEKNGLVLVKKSELDPAWEFYMDGDVLVEHSQGVEVARGMKALESYEALLFDVFSGEVCLAVEAFSSGNKITRLSRRNLAKRLIVHYGR